MRDELNQLFAHRDVAFTLESPTVGKFSTVYVAGTDAEFSQYGRFFGLAEAVDEGNQVKDDNAFVFSESIGNHGNLIVAIFPHFN
jgi:hypothetical protein